nr:hypothetical protein Iba_chr01aCG6850 [Ipomoea batatas]
MSIHSSASLYEVSCTSLHLTFMKIHTSTAYLWFMALKLCLVPELWMPTNWIVHPLRFSPVIAGSGCCGQTSRLSQLSPASSPNQATPPDLPCYCHRIYLVAAVATTVRKWSFTGSDAADAVPPSSEAQKHGRSK